MKIIIRKIRKKSIPDLNLDVRKAIFSVLKVIQKTLYLFSSTLQS